MHQAAPRHDTAARLAMPPKVAARGADAARAGPMVSVAIAITSAGAQNASWRPRERLMTCIGVPLFQVDRRAPRPAPAGSLEEVDVRRLTAVDLVPASAALLSCP